MNSDIILTSVLNFINCFLCKSIEKMAKDIGFCKRYSNLNPCTFVKVFVLGLADSARSSLSDIALKCESMQYGLSISRQAEVLR